VSTTLHGFDHRKASSRPGNRRARLVWQFALTAVLIVIAISGVGVRFELVGCLYLAFVTPELCRVDLAEHRLPNAIVLPGFAFAAIGAVFGWLATGRPPTAAALAAAAVGGFFALLAVTGGVGMGDVKLAAVLALAGGAASALVVAGPVVLGFIAAGVGAVVMLTARGGGGSIAFGPYLLGGFWASVAALPLVA
jgi:leader peptidase (prepilin peptidase)/N-methyltransferase